MSLSGMKSAGGRGGGAGGTSSRGEVGPGGEKVNGGKGELGLRFNVIVVRLSLFRLYANKNGYVSLMMPTIDSRKFLGLFEGIDDLSFGSVSRL